MQRRSKKKRGNNKNRLATGALLEIEKKRNIRNSLTARALGPRAPGGDRGREETSGTALSWER